MSGIAVMPKRRCHTVPSTIPAPMRAEIASAVIAGRSIAQTAKEYNADRSVVTEIWLREELRRMRMASLRVSDLQRVA